MIKKLSYMLFFVVLVSCSATGPIFQQVSNTLPNLSTIYIYHPRDAQYGSEEANFLYFNGQQVFRFTHGGYTYFQLEPGTHELQIRLSTFFVATDIVKDRLTIEAKPGETYFVKYMEESDGVEYWSTGTMAGAARLTDANLQQVSESVGLSEISSMRLIKHKLDLKY